VSLPKTIHTLLALAFAILLASPGRTDAGRDLVFLHYWTDSLSGGINEMAEAYNQAHPTARVRATGFEHESFKQGILSMLAGNSAPDMFSYWAGARTSDLVRRKYVAPIDRIWSEAGLDSVFPPFIQKACTYDGRKYALPLTLHHVAFFYNKDIFKEHGLTPPTTWPQFLNVCRTLRRAGVTPLALGCRERWPAQFWFDYLLLRTAGPDYRERLMRGEASYDDPEVSGAMCQWRQLLEDGDFNEQAAQLDWAEAAGLVQSGKAAMTLMGTWIIGLFDGQFGWRQDVDYGYFPFPAITPGTPTAALGAIDVILVAQNGSPEQVDRILAYFSDPGPQMEMSRGSGALSPSLAIPPSFYSPLKQRILRDVRDADCWSFSYDLATPPAVAGPGLEAFKLFVANPSDLREIFPRLAAKTRQVFADGQQ